MEILRDTPFDVATCVFPLRPPRPSLVVVVKATFALVAGECTVADEQVRCSGDRFVDDEPEKSLLAPSDLAPVKARGECWVTGACHPPGGRATTCVASFRVGSIARSLAVFGDRSWPDRLLGAPSAPEPFTAMPLMWERSFGGEGVEANPVGCGVVASEGAQGVARVALPNLEDPERLIRARGDRPAPVGFGPIHPAWPARARFLGTYDASWVASRWPWLPVDFSAQFHEACPEEQRIEGFFRGDEEIVLVNLLAASPRLATRLPGLRPRCFLEGSEGNKGRSWRHVPLALDTIGVDTEAAVVTCIWRGNVEVASEALDEIATLFVAHEPIRAPRDTAFYRERLDVLRAEKAAAEAEHEAEPIPELPADEPVVAAPLSVEVAKDTLRTFAAFGLDLGPELTAILAATVRAAKEGKREPPSPPGREEVGAKLAADGSLAKMDLTCADLSWMNLSGVDLTGAILTKAKLEGATLEGARLDDAVLSGANLRGAALPRASARRADFTGVKADRAIFDEAVLDEATLTEASLRGASFSRASCRETDLSRADLTQAALPAADLSGADLSGATLDHADLTRAILAEANLEGVHGLRVKLQNANLERARAAGAELPELDATSSNAACSVWSGASLEKAIFRSADLTRADFDAASMVAAVLSGAKLEGARFRGAIALRAVIVGADAREASFESTDLGDANLRGTSFYAAGFWKARVGGARFEGADLSRTLLERRS